MYSKDIMEFDGVDKEREAWKNFLAEWEWEMFITLNLPRGRFTKILKAYMISLQVQEHIQVAYQGVFNQLPQPHLHIVAFGRNAKGKTLCDVNPSVWEREWQNMTKKSAVIKPIPSLKDKKAIVSYIFDTNTPPGLHGHLTPYNTKLHIRCRTIVH